jgi:hypothetical protein
METLSELCVRLSQSDSRTTVLELVRWLDLRYAADREAAQALYAPLLVAVSPLLPDKPHIARTVAAAGQYASAPSEEHWAELFRAATSSYPFGPGEGCYCIDELGVQGCGPGSGCRSGAGSFASIAESYGYDAVATALLTTLDAYDVYDV